VLICHGFKGFKDWGMFPWIADRVAEAGLCAVRFDFSHNGVEARDFDRLDLFLLDTYARRQEDLAAVAARFPGPLGLLGHSRGGADALLFAAREPRVACVGTLAGVAHPARFPADVEEVLRARGWYPFRNARTGQTMPVARTAVDDARRRSVERAVGSLGRPLLVLHGSADESVPPEDAADLARWHGAAEVHVLEGAGHAFGAVHPFAGPTGDLERVVRLAVPFLVRHLAGKAG
jgi:pimeloyl-ACP methyl ester carboxylesterase